MVYQRAENMNEMPSLQREDSGDAGLVRKLPEGRSECHNNLGNCGDISAGTGEMMYERADTRNKMPSLRRTESEHAVLVKKLPEGRSECQNNLGNYGGISAGTGEMVYERAENMNEMPSLRRTDSEHAGHVKKLPACRSECQNNLGNCGDISAGTGQMVYEHAENMNEMPTLQRTDSQHAGLFRKLPEGQSECQNNLGNCFDISAGTGEMMEEHADTMNEMPTLHGVHSEHGGLISKLPEGRSECQNNLGNCCDISASTGQMVYERQRS
jgi:hypothetical protein